MRLQLTVNVGIGHAATLLPRLFWHHVGTRRSGDRDFGEP